MSVREAAERLLEDGRCCGGCGTPYSDPSVPRMQFDEIEVGEWVLDNLRADDDEPITEKAEFPFTHEGYFGSLEVCRSGVAYITQENESGQSVEHWSCISVKCKTRRDLRLLLAALHIQEKPHGDLS